MSAEHDPDWDDYAVYPFRRQVLDEHPPPAERPAQPQPPRPAPRRRRSRPNPLWIALPLALAVFVATIAATATFTRGDDAGVVPAVVEEQLAPVAEAAPQPVRRTAPRIRRIFVPDVVGLDRAAAVRLLKERRFLPRVRLVPGRPGEVLEQTPLAATEVKHRGVVVLSVGRPKRAAPSADGLD